MVSPSPSSQGPTWVLTGLTNLDMAGQRDVYREVDGLGERWCEMTDVVVRWREQPPSLPTGP